MSKICIFCGDHFGSLSQCLVLTSRLQSGYNIYYLTSTNDKEQIECLKSFENKGIIKVIIFDYKKFSKETNKEKLIFSIVEYFDGFLKKNHIKHENISEVYLSISGGYCSFGLYLFYRKIPYRFVEFATNELFTRKLEASINQYDSVSSAYKELAIDSGSIIGNNRLCKEHIYNNSSKINDELPGEIIKVDYAYELNNLDIRLKKQILGCYKLCELDKMKNSTIMIPNSESLTERAIKDKMFYCKELIAPYTLMIDMLNEKESLIIKPHPHGDFPFSTYFPDSMVLEKVFPIEFLHLFSDFFIRKSISIETNGNERISSLTKSEIAVGRHFMLNIDKMISLWFMILLIKLLSSDVILFIDEKFKNIIDIFSHINNVKKEKIKIVNNLEDLNFKDNIILSFESIKNFNMLNPDYVVIQRNAKKDSPFFSGVDQFLIYNNIDESLDVKFCGNYAFENSRLDCNITIDRG
ncbi:MAG TPA: hypothetical protein DC024_08890 [Clostridiales bacterium]|jgi:hypothetical protein|nr:hypothetical protein [Clostridiales bacterium]HCS10423.1 hypothetical protein [Clostridiales bacterium]